MASARSDIVTADLRGWAFGSIDAKHMALVSVPFAGRETTAPLAIRELALRQLCERIGAPAPYIRGLPAPMQAICMNHGLVSKPQPALLRTADGHLRAVLSERYAPVDDMVLFELIADALDRAGLRNEAMVRASVVGTSTVMRITLPSEGIAVKKGDVIEHGIDLGNSEVGLRSVQVTPVTYRLVCSNGMRAWQSESTSRFRHIGDPLRLRELLRDAIPIGFAEARGDIERWRRALDVRVDDVLAEIEALRAFSITGGDAQAVARTYALEAGVELVDPSVEALKSALSKRTTTVFELANAITATAKDKSAGPRLLLEESAHRYLSRRTR